MSLQFNSKRTCFTFQQRYPHCEIKLVPRVDYSLLPAASNIQKNEVVEVEDEDAAEEENTQQSLPNSTLNTQSQPKETTSTSRVP